MELQPISHGLWAATAPEAPETVPLRIEARADIAVIGAGFTGLSAALHLAESGADVAVVEANEIGFGGSGRNAGLVNAGLWLPLPEMVARLGAEAGERLIRDLGEAPGIVFDLIARHRIDCEAVRAGTLHLAHSVAGRRMLEARCAEWARRGAPVEILDTAAAAEATGARGYHGALLDRRAGTIQPLAYCRGLARAAIAAGARVFTGSPVTGLARTNGAWRLATPEGALAADRVLIATGAYGEGAAEARHATVPYFYFQCATKPLSHNLLAEILTGRQGAWDTHPVLKSFRLDAANRLVFGSVGRLDTGGSVHRDWARRGLRALFPNVPEGEWTHAWYGRIGMTRDHLPRLVAPAPGLLAIYGYNGRGIGPGTAFGRALARHLLSGDPADLPFPLTPTPREPFRALRGLAIEAGARLYHALR